MPTKKSKIHPKYKTKFRVRNWPSYDRALKRRGDLILWLSPSAISAWKALPSGTRGGQRLYSDVAIEAALMVRLVFRLPWRQTEGLLNSLLRMMGLPLRSPDHTTMSRRTRRLNLELDVPSRKDGVQVILDATGLKVFGRGEWAISKYGKGAKKPGWRKLHLAAAEDGVILACELTEPEVADAVMAPVLLGSIEGNVDKFTADGAYDRRIVYEAVGKRGAETVIPPRRDALVSSDPVFATRNRHIAHRKREGKRQWQADVGYHQQAKVENTFYRMKRSLGRELRARTDEGQRVEVMAKCQILNRFLKLGRPDSVAIG